MSIRGSVSVLAHIEPWEMPKGDKDGTRAEVV